MLGDDEGIVLTSGCDVPMPAPGCSLATVPTRLPKQWSTLHETSWEWLWTTVARNLNESTMKADGSDLCDV